MEAYALLPTNRIASRAMAGHRRREVGESTSHSLIGLPLPASKRFPSRASTSASTRAPKLDDEPVAHEHREDVSADLELSRRAEPLALADIGVPRPASIDRTSVAKRCSGVTA